VEEPVLIYRSSELIQFVLPTTTGNSGIHLDWADYILVTAGIITTALLGLLLLHILKIKLLKRKYDVTTMDGFDFINTNEENAPFTFLNNLFWKKSISLQEEGGQQIFKHEITHIQQKHTWDRIYCQIISSIFWMNPFNWIIQKELVAIHEFIADEAAVGNSNTEAFAKMLLQTHYGNHFLNPTNQFFYSSIKRRLTMLTKSTNTKYSYLRRVMVLPILIASVCIVSIKVNASEKIGKKVAEIKNDFSLLVSDTTKPIKKSSVKSLPTPPTPPAPPTPPSPPLVKPSYYLDGVKITEREMKTISPNDIESVNVLKGQQAIKKYPRNGENGVIEIITKKGRKTNLQDKTEDFTSVGNDLEGPVIFNAPKIQKDTDPSKNNEPIFYTADKSAQFPGGSEAWIKYLGKNLNANLPVVNGAPKGNYEVLLNFVVNSNGEVANVLASTNPGYGTASEAIRVIEKGPKWVPAVQNGKKVNFYLKQSIVFVVDK
jgi:outer membrane biosynthesis protein TonB